MITCQDILELQLDGVELIAGEKVSQDLSHGPIWCRPGLLRSI